MCAVLQESCDHLAVSVLAGVNEWSEALVVGAVNLRLREYQNLFFLKKKEKKKEKKREGQQLELTFAPPCTSTETASADP